MKIKKYFTYNSNRQIFRILISDSDKLIIEARNMDSKEVYFDCYDLIKCKKIFTGFQFEEKSWIGIETEHKDVIYFHKYDKPDMPRHRGVIAFEINTQKILWINEELAFLFPYGNKIYCYKQGFEERYFYALDSLTGELIEDLGNDFQLVNSLRGKSDSQKDWSTYNYPERFSSADEKTKAFINDFIKETGIDGNIEFCTKNNLLLFNYHTKTKMGKYDNIFAAVEIDSNKTIMKKTLNSDSTMFYTDSFFIYKNFLFLLKEKNEINIFTLE